MTRLDPKGIAAGVATFLVLVGAAVWWLNRSGSGLTVGSGYFLAYVLLWMIPGYVAATVASRNGALNGAAAGVVIGLMMLAFSLIWSNSSRGAGMFDLVLISAVFGLCAAAFCSLGGLLWDLTQRKSA